jgi:hypothetical protein
MSVVKGLVWGGMPMPVLTEISKLRLDTISFFLFLLILGTLAIQWGWNRMASDFNWIPQLRAGQAFALTALWGLLFLLVLTMISGARELMTPGAWQRDGQTYQLREIEPSANAIARAQRRQRLVDLTAFIRRWASQQGRLPVDLDEAGVPDELQSPPGSPFTSYRYFRPPQDEDEDRQKVGGVIDPNQRKLLAEPNVFADGPLTITLGGFFVAQEHRGASDE